MLASHDSFLQDAPRILLVDDEDLLSWCIEMELRALGFHARTASSLKMAREALADFEADLIICDQGLPDGWGTEFVKDLPHPVPVIMITAYTPPGHEDISAVRKVLRKPFDLNVLTSEVKKHVRTISRPASNPFPLPGAAWEG